MSNTGLLIIDIQQDYFPGGKMVLEGADTAAASAREALAATILNTAEYIPTLQE